MGTSDGKVLGATQVFGTAAPSGAFNIALLADGFRDLDQVTFNAVVDRLVQSFMTTPPFDRYTHCINVFRVHVVSIDAGADDPATGTVARTYFDSTFGTSSLSRLLTCSTATALVVAAQEVPEFTVCLLVVNSNTYGGSGGSVGTFSLANGALEIAIHELGHTAFGLADEYDYWAGGNEPGQAHHPPGEPSPMSRSIPTAPR